MIADLNLFGRKHQTHQNYGSYYLYVHQTHKMAEEIPKMIIANY